MIPLLTTPCARHPLDKYNAVYLAGVNLSRTGSARKMLNPNAAVCSLLSLDISSERVGHQVRPGVCVCVCVSGPCRGRVGGGGCSFRENLLIGFLRRGISLCLTDGRRLCNRLAIVTGSIKPLVNNGRGRLFLKLLVISGCVCV